MFQRRRRVKDNNNGVIQSSSSSSSPPSIEESKEDMTASVDSQQQQQQQQQTSSVSTRLALLCVENALSMGIRTKVCLCPPGKARSNLLSQHPPQSDLDDSFPGNDDYDEEEEELSSGDEEDGSTTTTPVSDLHHKEPWYNPNNANNSSNNNNNKLPFEYRKLKWLDQVTAQDMAEARLYLQNCVQKSKQYEQDLFFQKLRFIQNEQRKKLFPSQQQEKEAADACLPALQEPVHVLPTTHGHNRSTALSAALVIQSLLLCPKESLDGMSGLYDTLVNAGNAILLEGKSRISDTVRTALTSSLTKTAGDVWLALSKLYRYCYSARYQRRLVQRLAPCLIRPANAALWCLKHQKDMEAICTTVELILEEAPRIFFGNWLSSSEFEFVPQPRMVWKKTNAGIPLSVETHIRISIQKLFQDQWSTTHGSTANSQSDATSVKSKSRGISAQKLISSSASVVNTSKDTTNTNTSNNNSPPTTPNRMSSEETPPHTPKSTALLLTIKTPPRSPSSPTNTPTPINTSKSLLSPTKLALLEERAPLSPSSPSTLKLHKSQPSHNSSSSSVVSISTVSTTSSSISSSQLYLRSLTSTSVERKRTVAACRALRSQIARFEADFSKLHGRPPKGPTERAPLATTYAQYREWKKAIRADAACRIQALFRGAYTRTWLRNVFPDFSPKSFHQAHPPPPMQLELQIPYEEGDMHMPSTSTNPRSNQSYHKHNRSNSSGSNNDSMGVEVIISPSSANHHRHNNNKHAQPISPTWNASSPPTFRSSRRTSPSSSTNTTDVALTSANNSVTSMDNSFADMTLSSHYDQLSLGELKRMKRDLKEQLKQYDKEFYAKHKRMPVKAEKEPIRHLYERYNAVKGRITLLEKGGGARPSSSPSSPILEPPPTTTQPHKNMELEALKMEKNNLHQMLRSYEKEFYKTHNRQVASYVDIQPVASQYRRYKDIKKAIARITNTTTTNNNNNTTDSNSHTPSSSSSKPKQPSRG